VSQEDTVQHPFKERDTSIRFDQFGKGLGESSYRRFWEESLDRLDVFVKELNRKEGRHVSKRRRR
jgi:hypothetical protein